MPIRDSMTYDKEHGWIWKNPTEAIRAKNPAAYGDAPIGPTPVQNTPYTPSTAPAGSTPPALAPEAASPTPAYVPSGEPMSNDPLTDPNAQDRFITPENTMVNQRIGWDVRETDPAKIDAAFKQAMSASRGGGAQVGDSENLQYMFDQLRGDFEGGMNREDLIRRQFEAQQPFFDAQYEDQVKGQAERTAAMGRTGSGMYDREFADITERSRLQREGMLGSLTANAAAQAIQDRLGMYGAGANLAGIEANRDISGAQISNQFRGQGLQALLGAAGLDQNRQGADIGVDMARRNALVGERQYEYGLSRDAMSDQAMQMQYMNQGFESNPLDQINQTVSHEQDAAAQYGANAGQINSQLSEEAKARAAAGGGGVGPTSTEAVFGTPSSPTQFDRPRLTRPGSTINTTPIPTTKTNFGAVQ